ncbi:MAG: hypothetical protein M1829_005343 [Trizodia sp. TS-e1964]|nr:MAG: hypothetical protein M1829_005343 [Trizodia sp. TS-e1964]
MDAHTIDRPAVAHHTHQRKRLILCCDGTWKNSDNGYIPGTIIPWNPRGTLDVPSNVTRICRAIKPDSDSGIPQIVYYHAGVGTGNSTWDHLVGGGTGLGLSENIREAYSFLANNYNEEHHDEIHLIGFSRGAFTARSIAGLINTIGLLTKKGLPYFYEIFTDYENSRNGKYVPMFPDLPFANKTNILDPTYAGTLEELHLSRLNIPIKSVSVWDTVGSLGIPKLGIFNKLGLFTASKEFSFYDTTLTSNIENAFHALALDERRGPFSPTIWEKPAGCTTNLKQVWFPGAHSNVGGGYDDQEISNITLAWLMSQLQPFIDFDATYLEGAWELNEQYYAKVKETPRPWAMGKINNSSSAIYLLAGNETRTPGTYHQVNPDTGRPTATPLRDTNEYIHACVRIRIKQRGLGIEDKGIYNPRALRSWRLVDTDTEKNELSESEIKWEYTGRDLKFQGKVLREDALGDLERNLMTHDPLIYQRILKQKSPPPPPAIPEGLTSQH